MTEAWRLPYATTVQRCSGPRVVLNAAIAREIFVSADDRETLARRWGVTPGAINRIWNKTRWAEATEGLARPGDPDPVAAFDVVDAAFDESPVDEPPADVDSVGFRLSPSGRVALATIRRAGEPTRVVPADVARYRVLKEEAERRGHAVSIEGDAVAFGLWLFGSRQACEPREDVA